MTDFSDPPPIPGYNPGYTRPTVPQYGVVPQFKPFVPSSGSLTPFQYTPPPKPISLKPVSKKKSGSLWRFINPIHDVKLAATGLGNVAGLTLGNALKGTVYGMTSPLMFFPRIRKEIVELANMSESMPSGVVHMVVGGALDVGKLVTKNVIAGFDPRPNQVINPLKGTKWTKGPLGIPIAVNPEWMKEYPTLGGMAQGMIHTISPDNVGQYAMEVRTGKPISGHVLTDAMNLTMLLSPFKGLAKGAFVEASTEAAAAAAAKAASDAKLGTYAQGLASMDILEGLGDDAVKDYRVNIEEQMRSALDENQKAVLAEKEAYSRLEPREKLYNGLERVNHAIAKFGASPITVPLGALKRAVAIKQGGWAFKDTPNSMLWVGEKGAERYAEEVRKLQQKIRQDVENGLKPDIQDTLNLDKYQTLVAKKRNAAFSKDITRQLRVVLRRAGAVSSRVENSVREIEAKPEYKDKWGVLNAEEQQVVISSLNGRLQQDNALADHLGWDVEKVSSASRYNSRPRRYLSSKAARLGREYLSGNLSPEQTARLDAAISALQEIMQERTGKAVKGYGRRTPIDPQNFIPVMDIQVLRKALKDHGQTDMVAVIDQLEENGFWERPIHDTERMRVIAQLIDMSPKTIALDPSLYPPQMRENIAAYARLLRSIERDAASTFGGAPTPEGVGPGSRSPKPEAELANIGLPKETTRGYSDADTVIIRRGADFIQNSVRVLNKLRGKQRILADKIFVLQDKLNILERRAIRLQYELESIRIARRWREGEKMGDLAEEYQTTIQDIQKIIDSDLITRKQKALDKINEDIAAATSVYTLEQLAALQDELNLAISKTDAREAELAAAIEGVDIQSSELEDESSSIENDLEDIGGNPEELIDAFDQDTTISDMLNVDPETGVAPFMEDMNDPAQVKMTVDKANLLLENIESIVRNEVRPALAGEPGAVTPLDIISEYRNPLLDEVLEGVAQEFADDPETFDEFKHEAETEFIREREIQRLENPTPEDISSWKKQRIKELEEQIYTLNGQLILMGFGGDPPNYGPVYTPKYKGMERTPLGKRKVYEVGGKRLAGGEWDWWFKLSPEEKRYIARTYFQKPRIGERAPTSLEGLSIQTDFANGKDFVKKDFDVEIEKFLSIVRKIRELRKEVNKFKTRKNEFLIDTEYFNTDEASELYRSGLEGETPNLTPDDYRAIIGRAEYLIALKSATTETGKFKSPEAMNLVNKFVRQMRAALDLAEKNFNEAKSKKQRELSAARIKDLGVMFFDLQRRINNERLNASADRPWSVLVGDVIRGISFDMRRKMLIDVAIPEEVASIGNVVGDADWAAISDNFVKSMKGDQEAVAPVEPVPVEPAPSLIPVEKLVKEDEIVYESLDEWIEDREGEPLSDMDPDTVRELRKEAKRDLKYWDYYLDSEGRVREKAIEQSPGDPVAYESIEDFIEQEYGESIDSMDEEGVQDAYEWSTTALKNYDLYVDSEGKVRERQEAGESLSDFLDRIPSSRTGEESTSLTIGLSDLSDLSEKDLASLAKIKEIFVDNPDKVLYPNESVYGTSYRMYEAIRQILNWIDLVNLQKTEVGKLQAILYPPAEVIHPDFHARMIRGSAKDPVKIAAMEKDSQFHPLRVFNRNASIYLNTALENFDEIRTRSAIHGKSRTLTEQSLKRDFEKAAPGVRVYSRINRDAPPSTRKITIELDNGRIPEGIRPGITFPADTTVELLIDALRGLRTWIENDNGALVREGKQLGQNPKLIVRGYESSMNFFGLSKKAIVIKPDVLATIDQAIAALEKSTDQGWSEISDVGTIADPFPGIPDFAKGERAPLAAVKMPKKGYELPEVQLVMRQADELSKPMAPVTAPQDSVLRQADKAAAQRAEAIAANPLDYAKIGEATNTAEMLKALDLYTRSMKKLPKAEKELLNAQQREVKLEARLQRVGEEYDKQKIRLYKYQGLLEARTSEKTRLEARLGREMYTTGPALLSELELKGKTEPQVGDVVRPDVTTLYEGAVPTQDGKLIPRRLASYQTPNVRGEGNLARLVDLSPGLPVKIALREQYPAETLTGAAEARPGFTPTGDWVPVPGGEGDFYQARGPQYLPTGYSPDMARALIRTEITSEGLTGYNKNRSEHLRAGDRETIFNISDLAFRIGDEARNMELNEGFRALVTQFGQTPIEVLGKGDVIAGEQITKDLYDQAVEQAGSMPLEEIENFYQDAIANGDIVPPNTRTGMGAKAWGVPNPEAAFKYAVDSIYGRLLEQEMRNEGLVPIDPYRHLEANMSMRNADIGPDTLFVPRFMPEQITEYRRIQSLTGKMRLFERVSATITSKFKVSTLVFSINWQLGDLLTNVMLVRMTGIPVSEMWSMMNNIKQELYGNNVRALWNREFAPEVRGRRAMVAEESGLQDLSLTMEERAARLNAEVRSEKPKKLIGRVVERSFKFNEAINKITRQSYFNILLEKAMNEKGLSFEQMLEDKSWRMDENISKLVDEAAASANALLGDFMDLTYFERRYILPYFPFWTWTKHVHRVMLLLGKEHPQSLRWYFTLGALAFDPNNDKNKLGFFDSPFGLVSTNFMNPFADVMTGPIFGSIGQMSAAPAVRGIGPFPKLIASSLFNYDLTRLQPLSRPYGSAVVDERGRPIRGGYALEAFVNPKQAISDALGYSIQQFPLAQRLLDVNAFGLLPGDTIPGTKVATGPVLRYSTGQARLSNITNEPIRKPGGTIAALGRLFSLPGIPSKTNEQLSKQLLVDQQQAQAMQRARLIYESRYGG